jgi:noggin
MTESRLPEPLLQTAMTYYQTLPENVNVKELLLKLGAQFDPKWMSVDRPFEDMQKVEVSPTTAFDPDLLIDLRELNFSYVDEDIGVVKLKPQWQKAVEKWLLQKSSCPVQYLWDDVGPFFWPRWIKKGSCANVKACSWPPGMHCVPSPRPMTIRILRWHCRPRRVRTNPAKRNDPPRDVRKNRKRKQKKDKRNRRPFRVKCRWRKVRYPITTQCFCAC